MHNSKFREKKLIMDIASASQKTSQRLVSCAKRLLNCGVSYVLLRHMQSDTKNSLGNIGKGRWHIPDNCIVNVFQKFKVDKTRKFLDKQSGLTIFPPTNHHNDKHKLEVESYMSICESCKDQFPNECKQGLIYIAGFIAFKLSDYIQF